MTQLIQLITALQQLCETPKAALVLRRLGLLLKWTAWLATILLAEKIVSLLSALLT